MMLGIRTVVSKTEAQPHSSLSSADYSDVIKLQFPGRGSILTPAHIMRDFKFKDYSPFVYKKIREAFGINPADYLLCVCGNFQFLEFVSNSKSGQFFFYTHDRQFMIKTVSKQECKFLQLILPHYYAHIVANPDTLLTRFFGMHRVKPHKKRQRHFLIMSSVFYTDKFIHTVFDLKGSTQGRAATAKEIRSGNPVYKDLDFLQQKVQMRLSLFKARQLEQQIASDVDFLRRLSIMDYSSVRRRARTQRWPTAASAAAALLRTQPVPCLPCAAPLPALVCCWAYTTEIGLCRASCESERPEGRWR